jgi:hypothetical protein
VTAPPWDMAEPAARAAWWRRALNWAADCQRLRQVELEAELARPDAVDEDAHLGACEQQDGTFMILNSAGPQPRLETSLIEVPSGNCRVPRRNCPQVVQ